MNLNIINNPEFIHNLFISESQSGNINFLEKLLLDALHIIKTSAQLWLDLAEILRIQEQGISCKKVLNRALLLEPLASWEIEFKEKIKFLPDGIDREDINNLLQTSHPSLSAALIVKNEEKNIDTCIQSILNAVDEIIVVDTGSTDKTIEKLQKYEKVKLYHYKWCDDFSAARNYALSFVKNDWVFWLDADESLHPEDIQKVREVCGIFNDENFCPLLCATHLHSVSGDTIVNTNVVRLFKTNMNLTFQGKIHEQVTYKPNMPITKPLSILPVKIRLFHTGYELDGVTEFIKAERNIKILKEMLLENPNDKYLLFKYSGELLILGQNSNAVKYLEQYLENNISSETIDAQILLINAYISLNNLNIAENKCISFIKLSPNNKDLHILLSEIHKQKNLKTI